MREGSEGAKTGVIRTKESHVSITDLRKTKPSVFRSAANLILSTDVTVIVLWAVVGRFVTALAFSTGFISAPY